MPPTNKKGTLQTNNRNLHRVSFGVSIETKGFRKKTSTQQQSIKKIITQPKTKIQITLKTVIIIIIIHFILFKEDPLTKQPQKLYDCYCIHISNLIIVLSDYVL